MIKIKGFTIIEIMVVLAVIAAGTLAVIPSLSSKIESGDELISFFNDILNEHYKHSVEIGFPVTLTGFKGANNILKYDGKRVSIPKIDSINSAVVNSINSEGLEYYITVYPDGLCDFFELTTDKGIVIESIPLLMIVKRK